MATVRTRRWEYPRGSGKWKEAWILNYTDPDGKRRQETFKSKKAADHRRKEVEHEIDMGIHTVKHETVTLGEAMDAFIADCERRHRINDNMSGNSVFNYRYVVERHIRPVLGEMKLTQLTALRCQDLINDLADRYKATGIPHHTARMFGLALKFAVRRKWLKRSPLTDEPLRLPQGKKCEDCPTKQQLNDLKEVLSKKQYNERSHVYESRVAMITMALYAGLRAGEIAGLQWENLDFVNGMIEVRHSPSPRLTA